MENNDNLKVVEQVDIPQNIPTKTIFGAINSPTPQWATWMFRVVFLLTTVASGYLAATNLLSTEAKYEVTLVLKLVVDPLVYGLSKMFGIVVDNEEILDRIENNKN